MADFKLKNGEKLRTVIVEKANGVVIEPGDLVEVSPTTSGLVIKATATSTTLAWCPAGAASADLTAEVTVGNDFTLVGEGDDVFAEAYRGKVVDLVVNSTEQQIDVGTSSTNVLQISIATDAGVVGSDDKIEVRINKPCF